MSSQLPKLYLKTLETLRERPREHGCVWLGEAGFYVDPEASLRDPAAIRSALLNRHWPQMHFDLVPFARDSVDNQYCFVRNRNAAEPERWPVALWMYETGIALPIAGSFVAFLDWIGISAWEHTVEAVDHFVTMEHYQAILEPTLIALNRPVLRYRESVPTSMVTQLARHLRMARIDPQAVASRLVLALANLRRGNVERARADAGEAVRSAPWCALAHFVYAQTVATRLLHDEHMASMCQVLRTSLAFNGDPEMPHFSRLPQVDAGEVVAAMGAISARIDESDPLWDIVHMSAAENPAPWLRAALSHADENRLFDALAFAQNGLHVAMITGVRDAVHDPLLLLQELYEGLGWAEYVDLVQRARDHFDPLPQE